jgi:lipopolysaccharide transport system permease protein
MTQREVLGRYKGSFMGLAWSFFTPLLMLAVYTFIFSVVFKARWGDGGEESNTGFAVVMFVGMIVHGLFAEALNRAPGMILSNVNYVKKVVFPLEILPVIAMCASLFHTVISLGVLLAAYALFKGFIHWTAVFIPFVLFPLVLLSLGLAWMLASLGVFLRDVGQTIGLLTTVMMFLAPVFYPLTAVPEALRPLIMLNPLTFIIEQARNALVWGFLARLGRAGHLHPGRRRHRLGRLRLVPEDQKGICRCPLTILRSASATSVNATRCTAHRALVSNSLSCLVCSELPVRDRNSITVNSVR